MNTLKDNDAETIEDRQGGDAIAEIAKLAAMAFGGATSSDSEHDGLCEVVLQREATRKRKLDNRTRQAGKGIEPTASMGET